MAFSNHTMYVDDNGNLYGCGYNNYGQIQMPASSNVWSFVLCLTDVKMVAVGNNHTLALKNDGTVWSCGYNYYGQLGHNTNYQTSGANGWKQIWSNAKYVACGANTSFIIGNDGSLYAGGYGRYYQTSIYADTGSEAGRYTFANVFSGVKMVSSGNYHTFAITDTGILYACGYNYYGQLGTSSGYGATSGISFTQVMTDVKMACAGDSHSIVLKEDGTVWTAGANGSYQCARTGGNSAGFTQVFTGAVYISAGDIHSMCVGLDGKLYGVGASSSGQLTSAVTVTSTWVSISDSVETVICEGRTTLVKKTDGSLWTCGLNTYGQLASGNTTSSSTLTQRTTSVRLICDTSVPPPKYLFKMLDDIVTYNNGWSVIGSGSITEDMFKNYGLKSLPNVSEYPKDMSVYILYSVPPKVIDYIRTVEIYYAIYSKGKYYTWNDGWKEIALEQIYELGMNGTTLSSITTQDLKTIFYPDFITLYAVMKSNTPLRTPVINSVQFTFTNKYALDDSFVTTKLNEFNTVDWATINKITVAEDKPNDTDIRYCISVNGGVDWLSYANGWERTEDFSQGMSKAQLESLSAEEFSSVLDNKLDICVWMKSNNMLVTPTVDQITVDYNQIPTPSITTNMNVPIPEKGYKNKLTNSYNIVYELSLVEGIAFDSTSKDYDFYTTPDKIKIKPLSMGTIIGGRDTNIYSFELINTYSDQNFQIKLQVSSSGTMAEVSGNYCLLPDAQTNDEKTRVSLSLTETPFSPVYPLYFNLNAGEKRTVYLKLYPTVTTSGESKIQVFAVAQPI